MAADPPGGGAAQRKACRSLSKARLRVCISLLVFLSPSSCLPSSGRVALQGGGRASGVGAWGGRFPGACGLQATMRMRGGAPDGAGAAPLPSTQHVFQMTTQLFGFKHQQGQKDLFKILGISRDATQKEVRDAYFRLAKKWHPDKNRHRIEEAEARFKQISDAYVVLSNPAKRKAYEEGGRDGLEAHEAAESIDIKAIVRSLFGGGEFDDVTGDAGEIVMLKQMVAKMGEGDNEPETDADKERQEAREAEEAERMEKEEEEILKAIGEKLLKRLQPRAVGDVSEERFEKECAEWADHLCQAPGGLDLVKMVSKAWRSRAKVYLRRFWGLEGMLVRMQDWAGKISTGASLLSGAYKASKLTKEAMVKKNVTKVEKRAEDLLGEDDSDDEKGGEDDEISKEDMVKIAKVSLDVVWKLGIFLLQDRVRKSVDQMFKLYKTTPQFTRKGEQDMALALLQMSRAFRDQWEAKTTTNSTLRQGIPLDIDEMAAQAETAQAQAEQAKAQQEAQARAWGAQQGAWGRMDED